MNGAPANHHATAIAIAGTGILIRGPARSGKSALAFSTLRRAELLGLPARLVADDQVFLCVEGEALTARAPAAIAGLIEVSGVGILAEDWIAEARLGLLVDLAAPAAAPRLPEDGGATLMGVRIRRIVLPAREASFGADVLQGLVMKAAVAHR